MPGRYSVCVWGFYKLCTVTCHRYPKVIFTQKHYSTDHRSGRWHVLLEKWRGTPCVITIMSVACVHLVKKTEAAGIAKRSQLSSPRPGQAVWSVRAGDMDHQSHTKSHPVWSLSSSQPGGRRVGPALSFRPHCYRCPNLHLTLKVPSARWDLHESGVIGSW
jgi:hypothetical protein